MLSCNGSKSLIEIFYFIQDVYDVKALHFFRKAMRGSVTGESAIKSEYTGSGTLVLEPTYKYILLEDLDDWNGSIVLDDGMFLACEATCRQKTVMRSNLSSAIAGNEGLLI